MECTALEQFAPLGCHGTARRAHCFLADGYIREARERSEYRRHGARDKFSPRRSAGYLNGANIQRATSLAAHGSPLLARGLNDLCTIGLVAYHKSAGFTARTIFNNNNNGVTVIMVVSCIRFMIVINSRTALGSIARSRFCGSRSLPEMSIEFPVRYWSLLESLQ